MPAYISSIEVRPMPNLENLKKQAKLYRALASRPALSGRGAN